MASSGLDQAPIAAKGVSRRVLAKIKTSASDAGARAKLSDAAKALLSPDATVAELLGVLIERELLNDAVALLAHALPKREAVWWACLAARSIVDPKTLPEVLAALEAAEAWVYRPQDETRRAAMECAQRTQFDHAGVWAAVGAFWSGGSMVAPDLPAVAPAEHLTGLAVAGAVQLSATCREPERAPAKLQALLQQGLDIADGGNGRGKES
jgi:hypothetical protein